MEGIIFCSRIWVLRWSNEERSWSMSLRKLLRNIITNSSASVHSRPSNVLLCDQLQFRIILFVYYLLYLPCLPPSEQKTVAFNPVCNLEKSVVAVLLVSTPE
jgi:hypothetical protein